MLKENIMVRAPKYFSSLILRRGKMFKRKIITRKPKHFRSLVSEEGTYIGTRNDLALEDLILDNVKMSETFTRSPLITAIDPDVDNFKLSDVREFAFVYDGKGVVRVVKDKIVLWHMFLHAKK